MPPIQADLRAVVSVLSLILLTLASSCAFAQEPSADTRAHVTFRSSPLKAIVSLMSRSTASRV